MLAELPRQGGEERGQALDERGALFDQSARQRRDLEDQGARLGAKAFEAGYDELAGGNGGVEEVGIGHLPSALLVAHHRIANQRRRLHNETEMIRHLMGIALVFDHGERRVERAIETDGAQQGDLGIGRQALAAQRRLRVNAVVDQAAPAGKEP